MVFPQTLSVVFLFCLLHPLVAWGFQPFKGTGCLDSFFTKQRKLPTPYLHVVNPLQREELEIQAPLGHAKEDEIEFVHKKHYNWQEFRPKGFGLRQNLRWLITGNSILKKQESMEEMQDNLASLARMLILLRHYEKRHGVPKFGGPQVQRKLVVDIIKECYASGTPTWVLEAVMARVVEGLTGKERVQLMLLPNRAFVFYPASLSDADSKPGTELLTISAGLNMAKLGALEQLVVRLASFAGDTKSIERHNAALLRMPNKNEMITTAKQESKSVSMALENTDLEAEDLANEILNLAGDSYGLFYFLNSPRFQEAVNATDDSDHFWEVEDSTRNTFSRLAARDASTVMAQIQKTEKTLYPPVVANLFRFLSAAGACALWFNGSQYDMLVSGTLAVILAYLGSKPVDVFEERVAKEVLSSCFVGLSAGLLSIQWPNTFCFGAIAVASILDYLQGFKAVFGVLEVMTKNTVTGTARLLESILYTGLLSYSITFGLDLAKRILANPDATAALLPTNPVNPLFYPLLLPLATMGWSGLFHPGHADLPLMALHGMLAMGLCWAGFSVFASAMCVTFSAGLISRFTGREALGNTFAGLYALVPGTYMVRALMETSQVGFVENVLKIAVTIGLGGWTGTILCSPTILGKTSGLNGLSSFHNKNGRKKHRQSLMSF